MGREEIETRNRHAKSKVLSQKMKGAMAGMEVGERESESRGGKVRRGGKHSQKKGTEGRKEKQGESVKKRLGDYKAGKRKRETERKEREIQEKYCWRMKVKNSC